jgi:Flp pilus assembly protein TadB
VIGAALGLIVIGIVLVFFLPWVGVPVAVVGALLFALYLIGFGRRAATGRQP